MSNPNRTLALMHKKNDPSDLRTIDQLEAHYRSLEMNSPFAPLVQAFREADFEDEAGFAASQVINKARTQHVE